MDGKSKVVPWTGRGNKQVMQRPEYFPICYTKARLRPAQKRKHVGYVVSFVEERLEYKGRRVCLTFDGCYRRDIYVANRCMA